MLCVCRLTYHREGAAFTRANIGKGGNLIRVDRHHISLLRFIAPNLERAHAFFVTRDITKLEITATAPIFYQFRKGITQPTSTDVMDKRDRIICTSLPTTIDNFLTPSLNLRILALHGSKIQVFSARATRH